MGYYYLVNYGAILCELRWYIYIYIYISWDLSHVEIKIALFYKYVQQGANNLLVLRSQWYAQYICNTFPDSKQDKESKNSKENIDINILHQMLLYT